jgi:acetylxylan esterase
VHFCLGSASAYYSATSEYQRIAEQKGIILIYPDTALDNHCWDVATQKTLTHEGGGDSQSIANMVRYAIKKYNANPKKVFVTGTSSGAMMTNVLCATYPDMFHAAAAFSGVAHACIAGSKGSSPMSDTSPCTKGGISKTPQAWGDLVRSAYPGYTGSRPKIQIWHGTTDSIVRYNNLGEALKQWSNVFGVEFSKNVSSDPQEKYTKMVYGDGSKVIGYSAQGVGHTVPQHPKQVVEWFGL